MHFGTDTIAQAGPFDHSPRPAVQIGDSELDAALGQSAPHIFECRNGAAVEVVDRACIEDEPSGHLGAAVDDFEDAMLDMISVEKHEAGLDEVNDESLHR